MMSFVNDVQNWEKDTTQDVKVVINDVSYKPANQ